MLLSGSIALNMACGPELRVPFHDHLHVEIDLRMHQSFQSLGIELPLHVCADIFPSGYLNRSKHGFVLPLSACISQQLHGFGVRSLSVVVLGEFGQREQMP